MNKLFFSKFRVKILLSFIALFANYSQVQACSEKEINSEKNLLSSLVNTINNDGTTRKLLNEVLEAAKKGLEILDFLESHRGRDSKGLLCNDVRDIRKLAQDAVYTESQLKSLGFFQFQQKKSAYTKLTSNNRFAKQSAERMRKELSALENLETECHNSSGPTPFSGQEKISASMECVTKVLNAPSDYKKDAVQLVVEDGVDLDQYPAQIRSHDSNEEVTIGDLHGNTQKLIYYLIREGVITLDSDPKKAEKLYQELLDIYKPFDQKQLGDLKRIERFEKILQQSTIHPTKIRLIGDELADRGMNDYLTLLVLERLQQAGSPAQILLSNHGLEFIRYYETCLVKAFSKNPPKLGDFRSNISAGQTPSLMNFHNLLKNAPDATKVALFNRVKKMMDDTIYPNLHPIMFSKDADDGLTLYVHAPVGFETIETLSNHLGANCNLTKMREHEKYLVNCLQSVQKRWEDLKASRNASSDKKGWRGIAQMFDEEMANISRFKNEFGQYPLYQITWTRKHELTPERPETLSKDKNIHLRFVNGHDGGIALQENNSITIDNAHGKTPSALEYQRFKIRTLADYKSEVANMVRLEPQKEKEAEAVLHNSQQYSVVITKTKDY